MLDILKFSKPVDVSKVDPNLRGQTKIALKDHFAALGITGDAQVDYRPEGFKGSKGLNLVLLSDVPEDAIYQGRVGGLASGRRGNHFASFK